MAGPHTVQKTVMGWLAAFPHVPVVVIWNVHRHVVVGHAEQHGRPREGALVTTAVK